MKDGLYAKFSTPKGSILLSLTFSETPGTIGNFVGLAEGTIKNDVKEEGIPYYDGLKFHRVIEDFMIQGGCPQGSGVGGPGYQFNDEFHPELKHDKPGILSMANAGPGTNGSQFFITHIATPWLDGKHTVFGSVVEGQDVVDSISQNDTIDSLEIIRVGAEAEAFNAVEAFENFEANRLKSIEEQKKAQAEALKEVTEGFDQTDSGLFYKIETEGSGAKPIQGQNVSVHYKGSLLDGTVFDSSYNRNAPIDFALGVGQVIKGWDEGIALLSKGSKAIFIIPSDLGYGSAGAGGVIPPDATLRFEVELVDFK
jgi:peptidyl-prolyl cis-trans isomerase A (cyclophilin A)